MGCFAVHSASEQRGVAWVIGSGGDVLMRWVKGRVIGSGGDVLRRWVKGRVIDCDERMY